MIRLRTHRGAGLGIEVALLAVGVAAAVAAFAVARSGMDTSLRVLSPKRTYFVGRGTGEIPEAGARAYRAWGTRRDLFTQVGAFRVGAIRIEGRALTLDASAAWVTRDMIGLLRWELSAGRVLIRSDFAAPRASASPLGEERGVVVSESLADRLGLMGAPIGAVIETGNGSLRIVGVFANRMRFPYPKQPDLIIPLTAAGLGAGGLTVVGELRHGVAPGYAERTLSRTASAAGAGGRVVRLAPMRASLDPKAVQASEYGLALALVVLILLAASASLAEILDTIRARKTAAVKLALGASPRRLIFERVGAIGATTGVAMLAGVGVALVARPFAAHLGVPAYVGLRLGSPLLGLLAAVFLVLWTGVAAVPAVLAAPRHIPEGLKSEPALGRCGDSARAAVVALQVAASVACGLATARLASRLYAMSTEQIGISATRIWDGSLRWPAAARRIAGPRALEVRAELRARLLEIPGVAKAGFSSEIPSTGFHSIVTPALAPVGEVSIPENTAYFVATTFVGRDYLAMLGCKLVAGRYLDVGDFSSNPADFGNGPAILNEPLAHKIFGSRDPIGRRIADPRDHGRGQYNVVVGVVRGMRSLGLGRPVVPELFVPLGPYLPPSLTVRADGAAPVSFREVQSAAAGVVPGARLADYESLESRYRSALAAPAERFRLLSFFAILATAVAAFGSAAAFSAVIQEQDRAIGIRRALGAGDGALALNLLARILPPVGTGLAVGLVCNALLLQPLGPSLGEGRWTSGAPFSVAAILWVIIALALSLWPPLRRALRRPVQNLLQEG